MRHLVEGRRAQVVAACVRRRDRRCSACSPSSTCRSAAAVQADDERVVVRARQRRRDRRHLADGAAVGSEQPERPARELVVERIVEQLHRSSSPGQCRRATLTACASSPPRRPSRSCESAAAGCSCGRTWTRCCRSLGTWRRELHRARGRPRVSPRAGRRLRALPPGAHAGSRRSSRSSCAASRAATSRGTGTAGLDRLIRGEGPLHVPPP